MKAKFGKLSIGCFVALWVLIFSFVVLIHGDGLLLIGMMTYLLCLLLGIIFGIIGAIKKEKPIWYYIVGLLLNLGFIIAVVVVNVVALP